jgi:DNA-binding GntR family transcriptional regulator
METFIISHGFEQIANNDIAALEIILAEIYDVCQRGVKTTLALLDIRFHEIIIQACDHQGLLKIWQTTTFRMALRYQRHGDLMESYHEHERIVEAIRAGDKDATIAAIEANLK